MHSLFINTNHINRCFTEAELLVKKCSTVYVYKYEVDSATNNKSDHLNSKMEASLSE